MTMTMAVTDTGGHVVRQVARAPCGDGPSSTAAALGQWSGGRATGRRQPVGLLSPPQTAVGTTVLASESQH
ncbi:hypothetical protein ABT247_11375 [Kitasatospora sp. NPDC001539]|uniref:hypothetical protein n=1 Tax=Kitasatospora sp. NPDC001539 TaxID=3154384 RepID=UPI00332E8ECB